MIEHVFFIAAPDSVSGTSSDWMNTIALWRHVGMNVTFVSTERTSPRHRRALATLGCQLVEMPRVRLSEVPGIVDGVVVGLDVNLPLKGGDRLRRLGCRIVCVCDSWHPSLDRLKQISRCGPFDAYVFRSLHCVLASSQLLRPCGVEARQIFYIPQSLAIEECPFNPSTHSRKAAPFLFGQLSNAHPADFAPNIWGIYRRVATWPKRARVLGWTKEVGAKVGSPPPWVEILRIDDESVPVFLSRLHCLVQLGGTGPARYLRLLLKAMALGVPIVASDTADWRGIICHGRNGLLAGSDPSEIAYWVTKLARNEALRCQIACSARQDLEKHVASQDTVGHRWNELFEELAGNASQTRNTVLRRLRGPRHLRDRTLVVGIGTGRCGTRSLATLLSHQPCTEVTHQMRPLMPWDPKQVHEPIAARIARLLEQPFRVVGDVAFWYLPYLEEILESFPAARVICLKRDRGATIDSFVRCLARRKGGRVNHWIADRSEWEPDPFDACYPKYDAPTLAQALGRYWDEYYHRVDHALARWPQNVAVFQTGSPNGQSEIQAILDWAHIPLSGRTHAETEVNQCPI